MRKWFSVLTLVLLGAVLAGFCLIYKPMAAAAARTFESGLPVLYCLTGLSFGLVLGLDKLVIEGGTAGSWRVAVFPLLVKGIPLLLLTLALVLPTYLPIPLIFFRWTVEHHNLFITLSALALGNTLAVSLHKQKARKNKRTKG